MDYHNGIVNHYGDGSGDPIEIRTTKVLKLNYY